MQTRVRIRGTSVTAYQLSRIAFGGELTPYDLIRVLIYVSACRLLPTERVCIRSVHWQSGKGLACSTGCQIQVLTDRKLHCQTNTMFDRPIRKGKLR